MELNIKIYNDGGCKELEWGRIHMKSGNEIYNEGECGECGKSYYFCTCSSFDDGSVGPDKVLGNKGKKLKLKQQNLFDDFN